MHHPPLDTLQLPLLGRASADERRRGPGHRARARTADSGERGRDPRRPVPRPLGRAAATGHAALRPEGPARRRPQRRRRGILAAALQEYFPGAKPALVLGILRDKDWPAMCEILAPLAARILLCRFTASAPPRRTAWRKPAGAPTRRPRSASAHPWAKRWPQTAADSFVTVAGSLYLSARPWNCCTSRRRQPSDERGLNEWSSAARLRLPATLAGR